MVVSLLFIYTVRSFSIGVRPPLCVCVCVCVCFPKSGKGLLASAARECRNSRHTMDITKL